MKIKLPAKSIGWRQLFLIWNWPAIKSISDDKRKVGRWGFFLRPKEEPKEAQQKRTNQRTLFWAPNIWIDRPGPAGPDRLCTLAATVSNAEHSKKRRARVDWTNSGDVDGKHWHGAIGPTIDPLSFYYSTLTVFILVFFLNWNIDSPEGLFPQKKKKKNPQNPKKSEKSEKIVKFPEKKQKNRKQIFEKN